MITLDEAKAQLNITDASHDTELADYIAAVTGVVERQVGQVVTPRAVTERVDVCGASSLVLTWRPVISLTTVARVDGTQTWTVADLDVDTPTGLVRVQNGPMLDGLLSFTYQAGYSTVPPNWKLAARFIVQHLWKSQRGASGARMGGADAGGTLGAMSTVPRDVWILLGDPPPVVA